MQAGPAGDPANPVSDAEAEAFLEALPEGEPCNVILRALGAAEAALQGDGARHDAVLGPVGRLIRHGEQGHRGAVAALDTLRAMFAAAVADDPSRQRDRGEWQRMVGGAIGKVKATPTAAEDIGCCGPRDREGLDFDPADDGDASDKAPREKKGQSTVLVEMGLASYSFGRSDDGEPFAVPKEGPQVARLLRGSSESLRAELSRKYFSAHGTAARQAALADAMNTLHGFALESEPVELLLRVGEHQGSHYLDLGDATGQAVCIRPGLGWERVDRSPLMFRRNEATGVLPPPVSGGSLDDLWRFVNVPPEDRPVVLAVLVAMLIPDIPHPIVFLLGEAGTGKTNATKTLASLVDPSTAQVRKPPRDDESWITQASASWCIPIDNVTQLPPWLSASLCRASTGDGDIRRRLYTDAGVKVFSIVAASFSPALTLQGLGKTSPTVRAPYICNA